MKNLFSYKRVALAVAAAFSGLAVAGGPAIQPKSSAPVVDKGVAATAQGLGVGGNAGIADTKAPRFAPNRIIVKFKDTSWTRGFQYGKGAANPAVLAGQVQAAAAEQRTLASVGARVVKAFPGMGTMVLEVSGQGGQAVGRAIEALYRSGRVEYAHPDNIVKVQLTPNDPDFTALWGMHNTGQSGGTADADIDAPEAWDTRTGSATAVVVGVVDTGIDYNHPDLKANMWKNPGETAGNGIDDDGNGYIDDVYGIDAANNDADPMDDNNHGTHVAGTIGAKGNNSTQVVGVNWGAKLMALKFLSAGGSGYTSDAIELINYVVDIMSRHNINRVVLNNSWGGGGYDQGLYDAILAAQTAGVLFAAAAGNDNTNTDQVTYYPQGYDLPSIVSVGSMDRYEQRSGFSNFGCGSVDLMAPGSDILSTIPGGGTASFNGTSMATPHVAGAAALIWAQNPTWNWRKVKAALLNGVDAKAVYKGISLTGGRLNVKTSMASAIGSRPSPWSVVPFVGQPGDTIEINGTNFGTTQGTVTVGGVAATINSWTSTQISATLAANTPYGANSVMVTNNGGVASRAGACFNVSSTAAPIDQTLIPRAWHAGAKVGTNYWLIGGETPWGATGIVERYTPSSKRKMIDSNWMMPTTVTNAATAVIGSKIYVIGGIDWSTEPPTFKTTVQVFDTTTGTWSSAANLPREVAQAGAVGLPNGNIYVFGGYYGTYYSGTLSDKTYIYNPATNTWSEGAVMPEARRYPGVIGAGTANKAWVMGGRDSSYDDRGAFIYDAGLNSWTTKADTKANHYGPAAAWYKSQPNVFFGDSSTAGEYWNGSKWVQAYSGPDWYTSSAGVFTDVLIFGGYSYSAWTYNNIIYRLKR